MAARIPELAQEGIAPQRLVIAVLAVEVGRGRILGRPRRRVLAIVAVLVMLHVVETQEGERQHHRDAAKGGVKIVQQPRDEERRVDEVVRRRIVVGDRDEHVREEEECEPGKRELGKIQQAPEDEGELDAGHQHQEGIEPAVRKDGCGLCALLLRLGACERNQRVSPSLALPNRCYAGPVRRQCPVQPRASRVSNRMSAS